MKNVYFLSLVLLFSRAEAQGPSSRSSETTLPRKTLSVGAASVPNLTALNMSLKESIALAKSRATEFLDRKYAIELAEINYNRAFSRAWLPNFSASASSNSEWTVGRQKNPFESGEPEDSKKRGEPTTQLTLTLLQMNLYNGGADAIAFELARMDWDTAREDFLVFEKQFERRVAAIVFKYKFDRKGVIDAQKDLDTIESLVQQSRSKDDGLSLEVINTENQIDDAKSRLRESGFELNKLLGHELGTPYVFKDSLPFEKFSLKWSEISSKHIPNSPELRKLERNKRRSLRNLDQVRVNSGLKPKVSFDGIKVGYVFNSFEASTESYTTEQRSGNINLSASLSLEIPLFNEDGVLGSRKLQEAAVQVRQAESNALAAEMDFRIRVRSQFERISELERRVAGLQRAATESLRLLNSKVSSRATGIELREALREARLRDQEFRTALLERYTTVTELYASLGIGTGDNS
jgi:hypothetical protein